jgi:hypothetical protein
VNHDKTGPDISKADFTWCMTAISWGHGIEETAERFAELTAEKFGSAVARRERSRG